MRTGTDFGAGAAADNADFGLSATLTALLSLAVDLAGAFAAGFAKDPDPAGVGLAAVLATGLTGASTGFLATGLAAFEAALAVVTGLTAALAGVMIFFAGAFTMSLLWETARGEPRTGSLPNYP